jgi:hypothetical protein
LNLDFRADKLQQWADYLANLDRIIPVGLKKMIKFIIIGIALLLLEISLEILRSKLFKKIEQSSHKDLLAKMYLPKNILKPFRKPEWTPIKYVFKRKHKELNDKSLTNLSDTLLILYLILWIGTVYFVLLLSVQFG